VRARLALALLSVGCASTEARAVDARGGPSTEVLLDAPLAAQLDAVRTGAVAPPTLIAAYLARIEALDEAPSGPNAVLSVDPEARAGGGPLEGAVLLVKDNIDTRGLPTTAGSIALAENRPAADAVLVDRLRSAGAVILGKTNLSEWSNIRSSRATSGWSSAGGQTVNAAVPGANPCGSSAGSAAAVVAGFAAAAIGTETDGSLVCPASVHGIVAFKPTTGLVSRTGIIPISASQDTAGPMTRTVRGAARLLSVMAGPDAADPATASIPEALDLDFEDELAGARLAGARLGVVRSMTGYHAGLDAVFEGALRRLRGAGATLVDVELPPRSAYGADELRVLLHELRVGLNAYLAQRTGSGPRSLAALVTFNEAHAEQVMPHFGQDLFVRAARTSGLEDRAYLEAKARIRRLLGQEGILRVVEDRRLDALVAPTNPPAWEIDYAAGDQVAGGASGPAAVAGAPHLTLPMGAVEGRPVGLSVFGRPWDDETILALGAAAERALGL
jgi:amidase